MDLDADRIQGLLIDSVYANYYIAHKKIQLVIGKKMLGLRLNLL